MSTIVNYESGSFLPKFTQQSLPDSDDEPDIFVWSYPFMMHKGFFCIEIVSSPALIVDLFNAHVYSKPTLIKEFNE